MKTPDEVLYWSAKYPTVYDARHYEPFIARAREGDTHALEKVTEWKNPGAGTPPTPTRLSAKKQVAFQHLLDGLPRYLSAGGPLALREDYLSRAPVYAIFWHHVLFGTPIFDIHTNRAFHFFSMTTTLKGKDAAIRASAHWRLYDRYAEWFSGRLAELSKADPRITDRILDRALMQWGLANK